MAAQRSIPLFDKGYVNAQILTLATGYDPDTYVFEFGPDSFRHSARKAQSMIPFLLDCAVKEHGLTVEGKVKIVDDLIRPLFSVTDRVAKALYIKEIAERIDIDEAVIATKLRDGLQTKTRSDRRFLSKGIVDGRGITENKGEGRVLFETIHGSKRGRLEMQLISMMLQFPPILSEISKHRVLDYFENAALKQIGAAVCSLSEQRKSSKQAESDGITPSADLRIDDIAHALNDESVQQLVVQLAITDEDWTVEACNKLINHFVETGRKRNALKDIENRIKAAELSNDQALLEKLLTEKQNMAVLREKRKMAILNKG
jgi:DNA primase